MGLSILLLLLCLFFTPISAANLFTLVYKGCASQSFSNGGSAQTLATLSSSLTAKSASSKFYKTTSSSSMGQSISGLFQCRGDLSNKDCAACVQNLLPMLTSLCGNAVAARVQLNGCYALYQVPDFWRIREWFGFGWPGFSFFGEIGSGSLVKFWFCFW